MTGFSNDQIKEVLEYRKKANELMKLKQQLLDIPIDNKRFEELREQANALTRQLEKWQLPKN